MANKNPSSMRGGYARLAVVWVLVWAVIGGGLLYHGSKSSRQPSHSVQSAGFQTPEFSGARPPATFTKRIEDIKAGDRVWACDSATGQWSAREVIQPLVRDYEGDVVTVSVNGENLQATGNHPFWVVTAPGSQERPAAGRAQSPGRWVQARNLQVGDLLLRRSSRVAMVDAVSIGLSRQKVYNLEVADVHTYAVGGAGVLVHNCNPVIPNCFPAGTLVLMGNGSTKAIEKVRPGDWVLAANPKVGKSPRPAPVVGVIRDFAEYLVRVSMDSPSGLTTITSTRYHPYWTCNRGWVKAYQLTKGDVLQDERGAGDVNRGG